MEVRTPLTPITIPAMQRVLNDSSSHTLMFRRSVSPLNVVFSFRDGKRYDDAAEFHRLLPTESDLRRPPAR